MTIRYVFLLEGSSILHYGKLIHSEMIINSEQVAHVTKGVIFKNNRWHCVQCETDDAKYFHRYFSDFIKETLYIVENVYNLVVWII